MGKTIRTKLISLALAGLIVVAFVGCGITQSQATQPSTRESAIEAVGSELTDDSDGNNAITSVAATSTGGVRADTDAVWSEEDATAVISLSDTAIEVDGSGAAVRASVLTISKGGLYIISGTLSDGQILISAPSTDTVQLVLNGIDISSSTSAGIYESQGNKLIITLAEGTENKVSDATTYTYADVATEEPDAAIFAKHDLTINGTGSLLVNGNFNNGIGTKDALLIVSGNISVTAKNHGLRGRDSLTVLDGNLSVVAGSDGIQSNNDEDVSKGWINLSGGTYSITAASDGIQAETSLSISGGDFDITTGGGSASSGVTTTNASDSYKGIKATTEIAVTGGTFVLDCADDTVHSNGSITISEGNFTLSSGDDGVHADGDLTVSGGTIIITTCLEGLEASTMTISDGNITITSIDDGINIAGGVDSTAGNFGEDKFISGAKRWLLISGGNITVNAGRDAIDSNGDATMTGGTVSLTAAMVGEGETLDTDGTWTQTGGDLTESGGMSMGGHGGRGGPGGGMGGPGGGGMGAPGGVRPPQ